MGKMDERNAHEIKKHIIFHNFNKNNKKWLTIVRLHDIIKLSKRFADIGLMAWFKRFYRGAALRLSVAFCQCRCSGSQRAVCTPDKQAPVTYVQQSRARPCFSFLDDLAMMARLLFDVCSSWL